MFPHRGMADIPSCLCRMAAGAPQRGASSPPRWRQICISCVRPPGGETGALKTAAVLDAMPFTSTATMGQFCLTLQFSSSTMFPYTKIGMGQINTAICRHFRRKNRETPRREGRLWGLASILVFFSAALQFRIGKHRESTRSEPRPKFLEQRQGCRSDVYPCPLQRRDRQTERRVARGEHLRSSGFNWGHHK